MPSDPPTSPPRPRRRAASRGRRVAAAATSAAVLASTPAPPARADGPSTAPGAATAARGGDPYARLASLPVTTVTLPNGLLLAVHEDHRTPVASVQLRYRVGGRDDPPGRSGFAHLFEHMMFRGSRHVAPGTYWRTLEAAGGTHVNATTWDDSTVFYETVPVGRLNLALWMESDRMAFLLDRVDQATFDAEREVVLNEYRQSVENVAGGHVERWVQQAIFPPSHPYHRDSIGEPAELRAATLEDVRAFFRRWYAPDNATLVIAGDVDPARVRALVERYFGDIPRRAPGELPPPRVRQTALPPPPRTREARLEVEADVQTARVLIAWPGPTLGERDYGDTEALAGLLGYGAGSRLSRRLVHDARVATAVGVHLASSGLASTFVIDAAVAPGQRPEAVLAEIDAELARVREGAAPSDAEMARARNGVIAPTVFLLDQVAWRSGLLSYLEDLTGSFDGVTAMIAARAAATAAGVQAVARARFATERRAVALVYPTPGAPIAGRLRGGGGSAPAQ